MTASSSAASLIFLTNGEAGKLKGFVRKDPAGHADAWKRAAERELKAGPWTVTKERPTNIQLPPNEYYSEAPYFWPDPDHPGKMIRKDGERNQGRYQANRRDLGNMSAAVMALGAGAYLFEDLRYAGHAREVIRVWFIDPKTRMNPDLQHAQAIPGLNDGRPTGIIDTVSLIHCVQGMALLEKSGLWDQSEAAAARRWFADYLKWLNTAQNGIKEAESGNNHATWQTAQRAAFAAFVGDQAAEKQAFDWARTELLKQFQPNGAAPREEARTNSLGYSTFNLDAFATLARIAQVDGVDLWHGGDLAKAFHYIAPYVAHPADWKKQQISKFSPDGILFPGLAGLGLHDAVLLNIYNDLPRSEDPWVLLSDAIVHIEPNK